LFLIDQCQAETKNILLKAFQSAKDAFVQKITGLGWMRRVISPTPGHEPQEGFDSQRQPSIRVPFVPDR
jgi:hypothetical protein